MAHTTLLNIANCDNAIGRVVTATQVNAYWHGTAKHCGRSIQPQKPPAIRTLLHKAKQMLGLRTPVETSEHTRSYYAATAGSTCYPALVDDITADVAIIGGGFSGVNAALELSERGLDVVLLEANRIAWGATGRNGGQIIGGLGNNPERLRNRIGEDGVALLHAIGDECVTIAHERIEKYRIECDLRWGYCEVALNRRHLQQLQDSVQQFQQRGYPHALQLLDRDGIAQHIGSDAYRGGLYHATGAGHLHPLKLCQGEAAAAISQGARLFERSRVLRIDQGLRPRVVTATGSVSAKHLVLCCNGYLGNLIPQLARRMIPASSCIIATSPLPQALANTVLPSNAAVCDMRNDLDYYRLSADRRLLFGGLANYTGLVQGNYTDIVRSRMLKVFPQLAGVSIDFAWDGQMGISMNSIPQIGRFDDNCYYIQAFSGHGVAATHGMARLTADAICGTVSRFDQMSGIPHRAFPGGRYLRRPLTALGMQFYKARDKVTI